MLWYPVGWTAGYLVLLVLVAAPLRRSGRLHAARLRRGPARHPAGALGLLADGGRGRLALPAAAVPGRRHHAAVDGRRADLARAGDRRRRRARQRDVRRDAQHHLRPGVPVLAQAHRAADPGDGAARGVGRRRRAPCGRRRRLVDAAGVGRRPGALRHLLADPRHVPRHHGPAPRRGALLHQPRRPGRPPHDAGRAGAARRLLPAAAGLRRARPGLRAPPRRAREVRRAGARAAAADGRRSARRAAHRSGDRGRVRGVPLDVVRAVDRGRRRAQPGRDRPDLVAAWVASPRSGSGRSSR